MSLTWNEAVWTCIGGVVAIGVGIYMAFDTEEFEKPASRATGRVTEMVASNNWNFGDTIANGPDYSPRFEFQTPDGNTWTVLSNVGSNPAAFSVGDKVEVLYHPDNPAHARIRSFSQLWLWPWILCVGGAAALIIGAVTLHNLW